MYLFLPIYLLNVIIVGQCHSSTYRQCFEVWKYFTNKIIAIRTFIEKNLNLTEPLDRIKKNIKKTSNFIHSKIKKRYDEIQHGFHQKLY